MGAQKNQAFTFSESPASPCSIPLRWRKGFSFSSGSHQAMACLKESNTQIFKILLNEGGLLALAKLRKAELNINFSDRFYFTGKAV